MGSTSIDSKLMNRFMIDNTTPKLTFQVKSYSQIGILRRARRAAIENILRRTTP
jgi:hypothetical protein